MHGNMKKLSGCFFLNTVYKSVWPTWPTLLRSH